MRNVFKTGILLAGFWLPAAAGFSQQNLLQSGPMLGYVDMREALLWVQTKKAANVQFEYWEAGKPDSLHRTAKVRTEKASGYTAKCIADQVEPGRTYEYRLKINGMKVNLPYVTSFKTQALWKWRGDPPAFSAAVGSCAYVNEGPYDRPGKPYGSDYQIFNSLYAQHPDLMIWLGDNTYYREPDWATRTGMLHRYTHTRSLPELQPFLASTSHYAIWDDHDFGPDNSDGTWPLKEVSWEVFQNFWGNPSFGMPGQKGCTTWFQYGDADFFLLDNRYFRTPDLCKTCTGRTELGQAQLEWLLAGLAASRSTWKIVAVGGQLLTTSKDDETFANNAPAERDTLLARIEREGIKNVIFLTGDRHFAELSSLTNARGNVVYDLTTSPLTSGVNTWPNENALLVADTHVTEHNYALLEFSGPTKGRQLKISIHGTDGKERWARSISPQ